MTAHNKLFGRIGLTANNFRHSVLDEGVFKRVISRERKRAERSGSSLLMAIVTFIDFNSPAEPEKTAEIKALHLVGVIRETDVCGWLKEKDELGILFNLAEGQDIETSRQAVESKVREYLKQRLIHSTSQKLDISFQFFPEDRARRENTNNISLLFYPECSVEATHSDVVTALKLVMNLTVSLIALILLAPVFLFIALLVKATSAGPIFFRQERVGQFGKPFMLLKFRTMYADTDDSVHRNFIKAFIAQQISATGCSEPVDMIYKLRDDPRITQIGKILRKMSLDELPQFVNVLRGEMSLVGPRPAIPYEIETYQAWHFYRFLARKPGITGLWQVTGRSMTTFDEMVRLDLKYIRNWSIWLDIKLIIATPWAVFHAKGAY